MLLITPLITIDVFASYMMMIFSPLMPMPAPTTRHYARDARARHYFITDDYFRAIFAAAAEGALSDLLIIFVFITALLKML